MNQLFASGGQSIGVSASASVLLMNIQDWFLEDGLVWSPAVQGTVKSPPAPQFKSFNSSVLGFLYCPTLTSIHNYWKNHIFDYMDLCQQNKRKKKWKLNLFSCVWLFETQWTIQSMEFSKPEYWRILYLLQGIFPTVDSNSGLLYCRQIFYKLRH